MGYFLITPELKEDLRRCREYAEASDHWYRPAPGAVPPGDIPAHVLESGTVRAVFSWTISDGAVYRQLSVSTAAPNKYPLPVVVFTLADRLGFTGGVKDADGFVHQPYLRNLGTPFSNWVLHVNQTEGCIVVAQKALETIPGTS